MKKSFIFTGILLCTTTLFSFSQQTAEKGKLISLTEGGVLIGNSGNTKKAPFFFRSSLNYVLNKNLSAGLGVGAEFLDESYLPVTANALYQFRKNKVIFPFIRFTAGYQVALENTNRISYSVYYPLLNSDYAPTYYSLSKLKTQGGILFEPSAGVILYTKAGLGFVLSAGYRHLKLKYSGDNDYAFFSEYNRLLLGFGIIF